MMEFRILGPLEVTDDGRSLELGATKQQTLLAVLLLHPGEVVSPTRLMHELWGEAPPASGAKAVQGYVSGLRRLLGAETIVTRTGGYAPGARVARRRRVRAARHLGAVPRRARAVARARAARDRVRGPAPPTRPSGSASGGSRCSSGAWRPTSRSAPMPSSSPSCEELVAAHPLRERLRGAADARALPLRAPGRRARRSTSDTRTLPRRRARASSRASELRGLERLMLAQEPALGAARRPPEPPAARRRRGERAPRREAGRRRSSRAALAERLDPEALHELLDRCAERVDRAARRRRSRASSGESVVGRVRAGASCTRTTRCARSRGRARAARRRRARLRARRSRPARCSSPPARAATRSPPAARSASPPRSRTRRPRRDPDRRRAPHGLMATRVRAEPARARRRGAARRLAAAPPLARAADAPFVGRGAGARRAARGARRSPGASGRARRLTRGRAGGHRQVAARARARRRAGRRRDGRASAAARPTARGSPTARWPRSCASSATSRRCVAALLDGRPSRRAPIGSARSGAPTSPPSPRRRSGRCGGCSRRVARGRPLVASSSRTCTGRSRRCWTCSTTSSPSRRGARSCSSASPAPRLLERAPRRGRRRSPSASVLGARRAAGRRGARCSLARRRGARGAAARRIVEPRRGQPAVPRAARRDRRDDEATLPPRVEAVLAARLDRLDPGERALLEHAAVEGRTFHRGAALRCPGTRRRRRALIALAQPPADPPRAAPSTPGEDAFRFAHALIREAAYRAVPKRARAELHERLAELAARPSRDPEDEVVGFHLERAWRLPHRARPVEPGEGARRGGRGAAGRAPREAALRRGDAAAGARLLERASAARRRPAARDELLRALGAALFEAGRLADAERVLAESVDRAGAATRARRRAPRSSTSSCASTPTRRRDRAGAARGRDRPARSLAGDDLGLCRAWRLRGLDRVGREPSTPTAEVAWRRAAEHARRAGERARGGGGPRMVAPQPPRSAPRRSRRRSAAARRSSSAGARQPGRGWP